MPTTFTELDLLASLQATLASQQLTTLTDVQAQALPKMLDRRSVVAIAETGSGKTLTYVLPILDRLKRMENDGNRVDLESEPRAVVLVPTRELGEQVAKVFKTFTHETRLRVRTVLGGRRSKTNRESVAGAFEVLVATPGRLDAMLQGKRLSLDAVRFIVLDEADELLDMGFRPTTLEMVAACPSMRQLGMFSATMSDEVRGVVERLFRDADIVETAGAEQVVPSLTTMHVDVPDGKRLPALDRILAERPHGGTMLFGNTREQCDRIATHLREAGYSCAVHRGNMEAHVRRQTLRDFRAGKIKMLVASDLSARGIDIPGVSRVINVHLPRTLDAYLHRVGRTARAGRQGLVVNLVTPRDAPLLAALDDGSVAPDIVHPNPRR